MNEMSLLMLACVIQHTAVYNSLYCCSAFLYKQNVCYGRLNYNSGENFH